MVLKVGEARAWVRERERKRLVQEGKKRPEEEKSILSVKAFLGKTALKPEALKRYQKGCTYFTIRKQISVYYFFSSLSFNTTLKSKTMFYFKQFSLQRMVLST